MLLAMEGQAPSATTMVAGVPEVVQRRAEVFKMAMAEAIGRIPEVFFGEYGSSDFSWENGGMDPEVEYRACVLADMAHPIRAAGPVCFPCWEFHGYKGYRASLWCDRVSNHDALRFIPCRTAQARAGSAT